MSEKYLPDNPFEEIFHYDEFDIDIRHLKTELIFFTFKDICIIIGKSIFGGIVFAYLLSLIILDKLIETSFEYQLGEFVHPLFCRLNGPMMTSILTIFFVTIPHNMVYNQNKLFGLSAFYIWYIVYILIMYVSVVIGLGIGAAFGGYIKLDMPIMPSIECFFSQFNYQDIWQLLLHLFIIISIFSIYHYNLYKKRSDILNYADVYIDFGKSLIAHTIINTILICFLY